MKSPWIIRCLMLITLLQGGIVIDVSTAIAEGMSTSEVSEPCHGESGVAHEEQSTDSMSCCDADCGACSGACSTSLPSVVSIAMSGPMNDRFDLSFAGTVTAHSARFLKPPILV